MTIIKTTYNRRSFLKVSTAAGGGLVLGFNWLTSCTPTTSEQVLEMPEEWFKVNAFLKIGDNGVVTIMSPNPEIGQNVKTSMPMVVAEELDVDWDRVIVEQAPLDTEAFSRQVAGGSQSIRRGWNGLRMAGATARQLLLLAAAEKLQVTVSELTTDKGVIKHEASGQTLGYGEVASAAAGLAVPEEVPLKDPKDFTIIGTSRKNVDGKKIVQGEPLFGLDYREEGMLIAMVTHAPAFGLKIKSFDDSAAKGMPGIKDVFVINTNPENNERMRQTYAFPDMVAIVGNSTWEVMKAKKALQVEWEAESAAESSAMHDALMDEQLSQSKADPERKDGDPELAFAKAAKVVERSYSAPFLAHNPMEPMNFFANVTEEGAKLTGPIQTPQSMRGMVAELTGLPEEKVSVMMTRQGGGFGRRLYGHFGVEAALISQKVKAPVKLIYSREDDMTYGTYRPAYKVIYRAGLDASNNLIAFQVKGTGTHGSPIFANRFPAGTVDNYLAESFTKPSNISTGAWRAPRSNFIAFAEQSFLDEVAEEAGKDPIDFRLALFDKAISSPVGESNDYDAERYAGVLKLVREKSGWGQEMPGVYRGVSAYFCHNTYVAQVVDLVLENDKPVIQKVWCAVDCGIVINPDAARNQIEGGIVDGLGHGLFSSMTFEAGKPQHSNFNSYRMIRHGEAPKSIEVFFVDNGIDPTGLGEPSLPPIMAAFANALKKAKGERITNQPFIRETEVLG